MATRLKQRVVVKTANYTIVPWLDGDNTLFTNKGALAPVTFTLPRPNQAVLGVSYDFVVLANTQAVIVAAPTADTLVVNGEAAADSVQVATIGATMRATCLESTTGVFQWLVGGTLVGPTYTINT